MSRVIPFSRTFPAYHPMAGRPTYFVEKIYTNMLGSNFWIYASLDNIYELNKHLPEDVITKFVDSLERSVDFSDLSKGHTIRAGNRWKAGDWFSPRVWSGQPYKSKQIIIGPDIEVKKEWSFDLISDKLIIGGFFHCLVSQEEKIESFAKNDGLCTVDLLEWFKYPKPIKGNQIICWNDSISYI